MQIRKTNNIYDIKIVFNESNKHNFGIYTNFIINNVK